jgi:hypothetical protein
METWIPPSNPQILNIHKEIFIQIEFILILDVWWFNNPVQVEWRVPPWNRNLNSTFKPSNFKHPQTNFHPNWIYTIFRCLVIYQPALVELRDPPCLGTPIPPSNPRILNTYKEIFIQIEFILILDVWWFNNPALVELRGPICFKPSKFKQPQTNFHPKRIYTNFRCWVIWKLVHTSSARNPNFCLKKHTYKEKWTKHCVSCTFNIHLNDFRVCAKT